MSVSSESMVRDDGIPEVDFSLVSRSSDGCMDDEMQKNIQRLEPLAPFYCARPHRGHKLLGANV